MGYRVTRKWREPLRDAVFGTHSGHVAAQLAGRRRGTLAVSSDFLMGRGGLEPPSCGL